MKRVLALSFIFAVSVLGLAAQGRIVVGVIQSEPLAFSDAAGAPAGIHYELASAVFKKAGVEAEITILPKARLLEGIKNGSIDAGVFFSSPDVADKVVSAGVIDKVPFVAISKKGLVVAKYEDLYASASLSMLASTSVTPRFDADSKIKKVVVSDYETLGRLFVNNRSDTIIGNAWVLAYQLKKDGYTSIAAEQVFKFKDIPNELFLRRGSAAADRLAAISEALKALDKDGTLRSVVLKYAGDAVKSFK